MKTFKEMNISPTRRMLVGDKIKMARILNCEIIVHGFVVETSKYNENKSGKVMTLEIERDNERHIVFTGSDMLIDMISQVPEDSFPFKTTIVKMGECFQFT